MILSPFGSSLTRLHSLFQNIPNCDHLGKALQQITPIPPTQSLCLTWTAPSLKSPSTIPQTQWAGDLEDSLYWCPFLGIQTLVYSPLTEYQGWSIWPTVYRRSDGLSFPILVIRNYHFHLGHVYTLSVSSWTIFSKGSQLSCWKHLRTEASCQGPYKWSSKYILQVTVAPTNDLTASSWESLKEDHPAAPLLDSWPPESEIKHLLY